MWLKLNLDGIKFYFKVNGYKKSTRENWCDEWCDIELALQTEGWLNYSQSGELLLACEVEEMLSLFEKLLADHIPERKIVEFIEPDFKLILNPKKDLRQDPRYESVEEGYEIVDIHAAFRVFFWNGWPTENFLSLNMDRDDISAFAVYLKVITKQISKTDASVQELLNKGILLEY